MLSREEYNLTFDCDLSEETFTEIMGNPVSIFNDDLVSIVAVDHMGNKREFVAVTRCRDCKYSSHEPSCGDDNIYICNRTQWTRSDGANVGEGFCNRGEKKE